jgi:hypothetical protein
VANQSSQTTIEKVKVFSPKCGPKKSNKFAVYDIETTTDLKKVYLVGFFDGASYRYFESVPLPPNDFRSAISQFCMWYFSGKNRCAIYAHNGGNFDHLFVLRWLLTFKPEATIEFVPTQSSVLLMTVTIEKQKYEFRDSFRLMPASLDSISKTLLGRGKIENIDYETLHTDPRRYDYLQRDCTDLFRCILLWKKTVENRLAGACGLTVAATAIETLRRGYLKQTLVQTSTDVEALVREGYYGGRTEVFCKGGTFTKENPLRCYDVNSMYPWAMAQKLPTKLITATTGYLNLTCPGFVECTVDTSNCGSHALKYPVLPLRHNGKLCFPLGRFRGVWSTVELEMAHRMGYTITNVGRVAYFRSENVFENYVHSLYKLRDKSRGDYDETLSKIAKLLLNATYGKFGTNREREKLWVRPPLADIIDKGMRPLQGPLNLPVYVEEVQCDAEYILPHLAAWITALGRVRLLQYMYRCNLPVYYCDTDSIYTVDSMPSSTALGEMKEEYGDIIEAAFVAPKVYKLTHSDGHITSRIKGFSTFGRGFVGEIAALQAGESIQCSAFSKIRTVIRGDFGLIIRNKRLRGDSEKRIFDANGNSVPLEVRI